MTREHSRTETSTQKELRGIHLVGSLFFLHSPADPMKLPLRYFPIVALSYGLNLVVMVKCSSP